MEIELLLAQRESESLDFKECHHADTLSLLHDILCLVNSWAESDRYMLFGVCDDGTVAGVESDGNRRTGASMQDLLRSSRMNRIPTVSLETCRYEGHEVDVLTIKNRPDKPFFLTSDKTVGSRTIRAGVVYTRNGDTNVPLRESASEQAMELAWREHFGLGLSPLRRALRLLAEPERWQKVGGEEYFYHSDFPEFTIVEGSTLTQPFRESWTDRFPDKSARSYRVELRVSTTILRQLTFVNCDGGRYALPLPRRINGRYEISRGSLGWRVMQLYRQYLPAEDTLTRVGIDIVDGPFEDG